MPRRRKDRVDSNQNAVVDALRKMGYSVETGKDDLLIGHNGKTYWFELKDPEKALNKNGTYKSGTIKPSQIALIETWTGHYDIVHSIEQILEIIE